MARPRGYGYSLIPDQYPVRTRLVPVGYLPCQTGYLQTLQRVPVRIDPCYANVFGPWQRVPGFAYLPMQQVGRLWTQRLEASYTNRSQPLPPVAKNGLDTVFGHSAALAAVQNGKGTWCLPPPLPLGPSDGFIARRS
jgi:DNA-binding transcriptional LysR family regulator